MKPAAFRRIAPQDTRGRWWCGAALAAFAIVPLPCDAQRPGTEFVRQGLLVPAFSLAPGIDQRAAARAGDEARSAARKRTNGREVDVIDSDLIASTMARAGYKPTDSWPESSVWALGQHVRADEYLLGRVDADGRNGRPARVSGTLVLMRNRRLRQPLAPATSARLDDAATILGESLAGARVQLPHVRRCENSIRDGNAAAAARAARAGVAAYPRATMARTCLIWALKAGDAPAAEVLSVARETIAIDSTNFYALEAAALALDSLRRPRESAPYWVALAGTDTADLDLTGRALHSLHDGGSLEAAEALANRAAAANPEHLPFTRQQWRIAYDRQNLTAAITAAEILIAHDSLALDDPVFFRRLATVYRSASLPVKAVATVARGLSRFPGDARLYSLYAQYVMAEADTALPRGLGQFPQNGELLALHAQRLRARGNLAGSVDAMRLALAADSTIPDAALMLAQAELELGRPDSALVSLRRALASGTDSARLAQFAFARGSVLYRAAQGTKSSADHALALRFIALADSVRPTSQSRMLIGLVSLGVAQAAFTEAVALTDKVRQCELARMATAMLPLSRASLESGRELSAEVVDKGMAYLDQLEPYSVTAIKGFCEQ